MSQNFPVLNDKLVYQYGNADEPNYVFHKGDFEKRLSTGVKTVYKDMPYTTGEVDYLQGTRAKKTMYEIEISFANMFYSPFEIQSINNAFDGSKRMLFSYDIVHNGALGVHARRTFGKFYYNYARVTKPIDQIETIYDSAGKVQFDSTVILKQPPAFYDCSNAIEYVNYATYLASLSEWDNNTFDWDSNNPGWDSAAGTYGLISSLTNDQKYQFFTNLKTSPMDYLVLLRDRFFARDTTQAARLYILDETQNSNSQTDYVLTDDLKDTSTDNTIYRIELTAMNDGQSIEIRNITNNTAIKITWLAGAQSDNVLVYNSYTGKLYETTSETDIDPGSYLAEIPDDANDRLYFSALSAVRQVRFQPKEQVRLTNSTGTNLDVKIDVLPAYA